MKVNDVEFELDFIQPRTTKAGNNFVVLVGSGVEGYQRCRVKLTSIELTQIIDKLLVLSTMTGKY